MSAQVADDLVYSFVIEENGHVSGCDKYGHTVTQRENVGAVYFVAVAIQQCHSEGLEWKPATQCPDGCSEGVTIHMWLPVRFAVCNNILLQTCVKRKQFVKPPSRLRLVKQAHSYRCRMARITIVTDAWYPQVNGVVRTTDMTAKTLRDFGHTVDIVEPTGLLSLGVPFYPEVRLSFPYSAAISKRLRSFAPDHVHITTEGTLGLAVRAFCRSRGWVFSTSARKRAGST